MLELGTPAWCLWLFGLVAATAGLYLWHGLGRYFGLGKDATETDPSAAYAVCGVLVVTVVLELVLSSR
jgi:hypothetical protein